MKKAAEVYRIRAKELKNLIEKKETLLQEQLTFRSKLIEAKKLLHDSEIEQIQLLRRSWSPARVDRAVRNFEDAESGSRANICAPGSVEEDLQLFRLGINKSLVELYGQDAVEKMQASLQQVKTSVEGLEGLVKKVESELEDIDVLVEMTKQELSKLDRQVCAEAFEEVKIDLQKTMWPAIRRAFVTLNAFDPYNLRWPDDRIFGMLFGDKKFSITELLKERDLLRNELFGK